MRDQLLEAAERLVQDRGFNAVSFQNLADAVGLSKPSVFHHFPNKAALASALVQQCLSKYGPQYTQSIDSDLSAPEKLRSIAEHFELGLREDRLCLMGSLSHSVVSLEDEVKQELQAAIQSTVNRLASLFEQGREERSLEFIGEPKDAAAAMLALFQGLQVLARSSTDISLFSRGANAYINSLEPPAHK